MAYHLAIYILALNLLDPKSMRLTADELGRACVWLAVLQLNLPLRNSKLVALGELMEQERYCWSATIRNAAAVHFRALQDLSPGDEASFANVQNIISTESPF